MNVTGAWALGYTGKGISVSILDDGIERTHPDLIQNYDPDSSYDVNDDDNDPMPHYNQLNDNLDFSVSITEEVRIGFDSVFLVFLFLN
jgi:subtilisin family serine protease